MKKEALYHLLDRAFRKSLVQLEVSESQAAIVDLYLLPNPEAGEFSVFDDEDHELIKVPVEVWQENYETLDNEVELKECEAMLTEIANKIKDEGLFDRINILKPFSVLMVDEEMETLAELLLLDDEQYLIDDHFLKHMDEELDAFFEKLMADI
ncbi:MAG TPA: hypothetical protein VFP20_10800 [Bacteroidales bacterium]|nr:hypothetical protein [Bacteroidales bacterium]